jgi:hypothetical protein
LALQASLPPCRKAEFLGEGSVIENAAERPRECLLFVGVGGAVIVGEVSAGDRGIGVDEAEASFRLKSFPKMRFARLGACRRHGWSGKRHGRRRFVIFCGGDALPYAS